MMLLMSVFTATTAWAADITQNTAVVIKSSNKATYHNKSIAGTVPANSSAGNNDDFISKGAIVVDGIELNLTIDGFNTDYSNEPSIRSGISLVNGAKLHLTVKGENTLKAGLGGAGIAVPAGCMLEITAASTGTLNATGGNGSGGGAGIGSIGDRNDTSFDPNSLLPQGLGTIIINGGTINAKGGTWFTYYTPCGGAAGIGSSELSGATTTDTSWGSMTYLNNITGSITINDGTVNATGGTGAAGIGGGIDGTLQAISINGGTVSATSGTKAAAIGTGYNSFTSGSGSLTGAAISITGGTVTANGNLGFGEAVNAGQNIGGSVTVSGTANLTAPGYYLQTIHATIYDDALTVGTHSNAQLTVSGGYHAIADIIVTEARKGTATFRFYRTSKWHGDNASITITCDNHQWTKQSYFSDYTWTVVMTGTYSGTSVATYLDENGDEQTTDVVPTPLVSGGNIGSGWYTVSGTVTLNETLTTNGTVNLILCNGAELEANKSIFVQSGTLNIYAQTRDEETMGKLSALCSTLYTPITVGGTLVINGGKISTSANYNIGAGIGGSFNVNSGNFGTVIINDGIVTASTYGSYAYGIGCANDTHGSGGSITINGGKVRVNNYGIGGSGTTIHLGWKHTDGNLYITRFDGTLTFDKNFVEENTNTLITSGNIADKTIVPAYKVTFDANGGTGSMAAQYVSVGADYILPNFNFTAPTYYAFSHWEINGFDYVAGASITPDNDIMATAIYALNLPLPYNSVGGYYEIADADALTSLAEIVNDGKISCEGLVFLQTDNITLTGNWTPIAKYLQNNPTFKGTYDGGGKTISGLYLYNTGTKTSKASYFGLIGRLGNGGTVRNVHLVNCSVTGFRFLGGIAGRNYGRIENCEVSGTISGNGRKDEDKTNFYIGGITGSNAGYIINCKTSAVIDKGSAASDVGLIVGRNSYDKNNSGTVMDCYYYKAAASNVTDAVGYNVTSGVNENLTQVYALNIGISGVTVTAANSTVNIGGTDYYAEGATVTLGYDDREGYTFSCYSVSPAQTITNGTFTMPASDVAVSAIFTKNVLTLANVSDNGETIETAAASGMVYEVTLQGRTLYKDGYWNTIVLPFAISDFTGTPLEGATVKELLTTSNFNNGTLTLNFSDALSAIEAGKPYIVKWTSGDDLVNPVFTGVTIDNTNRDVTFTGGSFKGTYAPISYDADNKSILLLGVKNGKNTLYWPKNGAKVNVCRAYFEMTDGALARQFVLNLDDEATGIQSKENGEWVMDNSAGAWYTIDGVRLNAQPTVRGLYIRGGKKVFVE